MIMIISQQRSFNACTTWRHLFYQKFGVDWLVTNIEPFAIGKILVSGCHNGSQKDWKQPNSRTWLAKMDWRRQGCIFHDTESTFFVLKKAKKGRERKNKTKETNVVITMVKTSASRPKGRRKMSNCREIWSQLRTSKIWSDSYNHINPNTKKTSSVGFLFGHTEMCVIRCKLNFELDERVTFALIYITIILGWVWDYCFNLFAE